MKDISRKDIVTLTEEEDKIKEVEEEEAEEVFKEIVLIKINTKNLIINIKNGLIMVQWMKIL